MIQNTGLPNVHIETISPENGAINTNASNVSHQTVNFPREKGGAVNVHGLKGGPSGSQVASLEANNPYLRQDFDLDKVESKSNFQEKLKITLSDQQKARLQSDVESVEMGYYGSGSVNASSDSPLGRAKAENDVDQAYLRPDFDLDKTKSNFQAKLNAVLIGERQIRLEADKESAEGVHY